MAWDTHPFRRTIRSKHSWRTEDGGRHPYLMAAGVVVPFCCLDMGNIWWGISRQTLHPIYPLLFNYDDGTRYDHDDHDGLGWRRWDSRYRSIPAQAGFLTHTCMYTLSIIKHHISLSMS